MKYPFLAMLLELSVNEVDAYDVFLYTKRCPTSMHHRNLSSLEALSLLRLFNALEALSPTAFWRIIRLTPFYKSLRYPQLGSPSSVTLLIGKEKKKRKFEKENN